MPPRFKVKQEQDREGDLQLAAVIIVSLGVEIFRTRSFHQEWSGFYGEMTCGFSVCPLALRRLPFTLQAFPSIMVCGLIAAALLYCDPPFAVRPTHKRPMRKRPTHEQGDSHA